MMLGAAFVMTGSSVASAQSNAPSDSTKIVIGSNGGGGISQVPINVAIQEGMFKKAGLDVEIQFLNGGTPAAMAAFSAGSVNLLAVSAPEIIPYISRKAVSGKIFAEIFDQGYDVVAVPGITDIKDFKGKILGISGPNSADYVFLVATLQHYGLSLSDVTFITSGGSFNRLAALTKGVIQGTAGLIAQRVEMAKVGTILLKSGDNPVGFPQVMFIANTELLNNHKPLLKNFIAAMLQATQWMKANPAEAAAICAKAIASTVEICTDCAQLRPVGEQQVLVVVDLRDQCRGRQISPCSDGDARSRDQGSHARRHR